MKLQVGDWIQWEKNGNIEEILKVWHTGPDSSYKTNSGYIFTQYKDGYKKVIKPESKKEEFSLKVGDYVECWNDDNKRFNGTLESIELRGGKEIEFRLKEFNDYFNQCKKVPTPEHKKEIVLQPGDYVECWNGYSSFRVRGYLKAIEFRVKKGIRFYIDGYGNYFNQCKKVTRPKVDNSKYVCSIIKKD